MIKKRYLVWLFCLLQSAHIFAWNALGHRLIAQIAYDHMTTQARHVFNHYNQVLNKNHKPQSFVNAAVWLDRLYTNDLKQLKTMHYIDIPFSTDGTTLPPILAMNAVWAINMATNVLNNPSATDLEKSIALRIILHVVGDLHQPLHAVMRVSAAYPNGDHGGNFVWLAKNPVAKNLHAYWDRGAGLFVGQSSYRAAQVKTMARAIEQREPCNPTAADLTPMSWAKESHALAINTAYRLPDDNRPDERYQQTAQRVAEQRVALAGCRLAGLLNQIAGRLRT